MRDQIDPLWLLRSLPNMPACHVSIALDARGPCNTLTVDSTSSLVALGEAATAIELGKADVMVVGASGSWTTPTRLLQRHECLYTNASLSEGSCRPFDAQRNGTVPAEGAAAVILESEDHAMRRGANILGRLHAWGNRFKAPLAPLAASPQAVTSAISDVLTRSKVPIDQIDFVLASANGSIAIDRAEAQGIAAVGNRPVTSFKSRLGDAGCSAGMLELVAGILALRMETIPDTLFHTRIAEDCPIDVVAGTPRSTRFGRMLQLSTTVHGQAAAALISLAN